MFFSLFVPSLASPLVPCYGLEAERIRAQGSWHSWMPCQASVTCWPRKISTRPRQCVKALRDIFDLDSSLFPMIGSHLLHQARSGPSPMTQPMTVLVWKGLTILHPEQLPPQCHLALQLNIKWQVLLPLLLVQSFQISTSKDQRFRISSTKEQYLWTHPIRSRWLVVFLFRLLELYQISLCRS